MSTTRRAFLRSSIGSSALVSLAPTLPHFLFDTSLSAARTDERTRGDNVLVVVQLSGGNDGLNTVIPYADDVYHRNRSILNAAGNAIRIDDAIALHSQMRGLADLLENDELAIVQGVGYPNPNRSHFESMDIWHTARLDGGADLGGRRTGWIGRALDPLAASGGDICALHLGSGRQPLALAGEAVTSATVRSLDDFKLRGSGGGVRSAIDSATSAERDGADPLLGFVQRSTLTALASSDRLQDALKKYSTPVNYPGTGLGQQLRTVAQLIDAGLGTRVYYLELGGFDTHAQQAAAHAGLLGQLAQAVTAFFKDLHHQGQSDRVVLMTFSEFGRRVKENASAGTDHGVAGPMFLAGPKVRSGLIGHHPSLTDLTDGDLKHHTDFRAVYGTLIDSWLGLDSAQVLGKKYEPVRVLRG